MKLNQTWQLLASIYAQILHNRQPSRFINDPDYRRQDNEKTACCYTPLRETFHILHTLLCSHATSWFARTDHTNTNYLIEFQRI